jgi:hypothetical protein
MTTEKDFTLVREGLTWVPDDSKGYRISHEALDRIETRVAELEAIHNAARTELDNFRGYMNSDAYHALSNALNP